MIEQRTEAWHLQRIGKFTGSEVYRLMTLPRTKKAKEEGELSEGAKTYVFEKVVEQITGHTKEIFGDALDWGTDHEAEGIRFYEQEVLHLVESTGFHRLYEDENPLDAGASPDGLIGDQGVLEIKCPFNPENHFKNLLLENVEELKKLHKNYYWQMQMEMVSTDRMWCDFVSYGAHDYIPQDLKLKVIRVFRNDADVEFLKERIDKAIQYKNELIKKLEKH